MRAGDLTASADSSDQTPTLPTKPAELDGLPREAFRRRVNEAERAELGMLFDELARRYTIDFKSIALD